MPTVIPVKFKFSAHDLWFSPAGSGAVEADHVICQTERGQEIGLATSDAFDVTADELHDTCGDAPLRNVLRVATEDDLVRADDLATKGEQAFGTFRKLVHESDLDMKPVGVEYPFGGDKVVCYFSAEERVDFRKLVRDLSHALHERVDMRQIGVREEAAIIGGYGHCGQELCCRRFGHQFEPVSIRMAKEQDLPLNSSKISGACGRLMCCLRYEFEAYRDFKQRAPKRNAVIETPLGKAKIVEYDTPKEELALRLEDGKTIRVPLSGMTASKAAHKKSEELGCPCRPDTVTREALDKLNSPDVQMALAELDREHGVIPPEQTFSQSDIFVDTVSHKSSSPRRRKHNGPQQAKGSAGSEEKGGSRSSSTSTRRRRHRGAPTQGEAASSERPAPRHAAPASASAEKEGAATTTRHRRRHHKSEQGGQPQQSQGAQASRQSGSKEGSGSNGSGSNQPRGGGMRPSRRRRHPGDHGGSSSPQQGQRGNARPKDEGGQAQQARGGAQGSQQPRGPEGGSGQHKRRRHHHSGGNANGGQHPSGGQGGAPSGSTSGGSHKE